jgi:hypothetical protein
MASLVSPIWLISGMVATRIIGKRIRVYIPNGHREEEGIG